MAADDQQKAPPVRKDSLARIEKRRRPRRARSNSRGGSDAGAEMAAAAQHPSPRLGDGSTPRASLDAVANPLQADPSMILSLETAAGVYRHPGSWFFLEFRDPDEEAAFLRRYDARTTSVFRLWAAIFLFFHALTFVLEDAREYDGDTLRRTLLYARGPSVLLALASVGATFTAAWRERRLPYQPFLAASLVAQGACLLLVSYAAHGHDERAGDEIVLPNTAVVAVIVAYTAYRLRMRWATLAGWTVQALANALFAPLVATGWEEVTWRTLAFNVPFTAFNLVGMLFAYQIERDERQNFVKNRQFLKEAALAEYEAARAQYLLYNVLPPRIVYRLRNQPTISERIESVSVCFLCIENLFDLTSSLSTRRSVQLINDIFGIVDRRAEEFGVLRIKVIQDKYMCVCGAPDEREDHAPAMASMVLRVFKDFAEVVGEAGSGLSFTYRAGIAAGPVMAGVVGLSRIQYDIYGDTVNTASRMESPKGGDKMSGTVRVNRSAYRLMQFTHEFERLPDVQAKGKGALQSWALVGEKSDVPAGEDDRLREARRAAAEEEAADEARESGGRAQPAVVDEDEEEEEEKGEEGEEDEQVEVVVDDAEKDKGGLDLARVQEAYAGGGSAPVAELAEKQPRKEKRRNRAMSVVLQAAVRVAQLATEAVPAFRASREVREEEDEEEEEENEAEEEEQQQDDRNERGKEDHHQQQQGNDDKDSDDNNEASANSNDNEQEPVVPSGLAASSSSPTSLRKAGSASRSKRKNDKAFALMRSSTRRILQSRRKRRRRSSAATALDASELEPPVLNIPRYVADAEESSDYPQPPWSQMEADERDAFRRARFATRLLRQPTLYTCFLVALGVYLLLGAMEPLIARDFRFDVVYGYRYALVLPLWLLHWLLAYLPLYTVNVSASMAVASVLAMVAAASRVQQEVEADPYSGAEFYAPLPVAFACYLGFAVFGLGTRWVALMVVSVLAYLGGEWALGSPMTSERSYFAFYAVGLLVFGVYIGWTLESRALLNWHFSSAARREKNAVVQRRGEADALLKSVVPPEVVPMLTSMTDMSGLAEEYRRVTILFSDVAGFTAMCNTMTPMRLVNWLNTFFSLFDTLAERYGVTNVKTIGDAVVLCGGLFGGNPHHTNAVVNCGISMQRELARRNRTHPAYVKRPVRLRVGVHVGPVVAGIIGRKRFQFDVFGRSVRKAEEMESSGEVGRVHVSDAARRSLVRADALYEFARGEAHADGDPTWFVDAAPKDGGDSGSPRRRDKVRSMLGSIIDTSTSLIDTEADGLRPSVQRHASRGDVRAGGGGGGGGQ